MLETPTESFAKYISGTLAEKMREAIIKADVGISDFRLKVLFSRASGPRPVNIVSIISFTNCSLVT